MADVSKVSPNVNNYSMPRGKLLFAPMDDEGVMHGYVDIGNVVSLDLTNGAVFKDHETSQEGVVVLDAKLPAAQKWTVKFTPEERSKENMALFFLGDPDKQKGASADRLDQTGETIAQAGLDRVMYLDRWLDLGKKYIVPGSINLHDTQAGIATALTDFVCGTYAVDYENGLVMIKSNNTLNINDEDDITWDFVCGTCSLPVFVPRTRPMIGALLYFGVSEVGPRHEVKCWKVQIAPDAALGLIKPQDIAGLSFTGDIFKTDGSCDAEVIAHPFFRVTELTAALSYPS